MRLAEEVPPVKPPAKRIAKAKPVAKRVAIAEIKPAKRRVVAPTKRRIVRVDASTPLGTLRVK
jgi:hypothetical protein